MDFPLKMSAKTAQAAKIGGVIVLALLLLTIVSELFAPNLGGIMQRGVITKFAPSSSMGGAYNMADQMAMPELSIRNIAGIPPITPTPSGVPGNDAEEFEVRDYTAYIQTRHLTETCATISELKSKSYVIFESSNEYDHGCNYTFKVDNDNINEILAVIESLNPRDLNENIYTIKRQIEDFTSETEILKKKKESIESTLENAIKAYDEITKLATETRDAESLAKIIDSKIRIIESLTQQQIYVNEQLDRLERAKAEQLDRLEYTYFYVNVVEDKFVNGEDLKDSWKMAVKDAVREVNGVIQGVSVTLIALLFLAAQYVLYGVILLFIAKYAWKLAKTIWKK